LIEDKQLNDKSLVINTHLDHESKESQVQSLRIILETINNLVAEDAKYRKKPIDSIYIIGDFNVDDRDPIFEILEQSKYRFASARRIADTYDTEVNTFHGFEGPDYQGSAIIDHIFVSTTKAIARFKVLLDEAPFASDHYPVVVDLFKP